MLHLLMKALIVRIAERSQLSAISISAPTVKTIIYVSSAIPKTNTTTSAITSS